MPRSTDRRNGRRKLDAALHDPVAVAVILDEAGVEDLGFDYRGGERFRIDLIDDSHHPVQTAVEKLPEGMEGTRIPRGFDVSEFWALIDRALSASQGVDQA